MKKVLEGELISLAHSILKLKNRADIFELKDKAQALHEKLTVLAYAEKHFDGPQPTLGKKEFVTFLEEVSIEEVEEALNVAENRAEQNDDKIEEQAEISKESEQETTPIETAPEAEAPLTHAKTTPVEAENANPKEVSPSKIEEDFGVHYDQLPQFEPLIKDEKFVSIKADEAIEKAEEKNENNNEAKEKQASVSLEKEDATKEENIIQPTAEPSKKPIQIEEKQAPVKEEAVATPQKTMDLFSQDKKSLNDQLRKGIKIGLNDRLAFTKHLFDNDVADYNRVLSQLNTFSSPEEAITFINEAVKPSYQNWENKEEYETRFVASVVARFE